MRIRVCISLPSLRLMTDFIVDPLVDFCVDVIGEIGYAGIFLLMLVESANIPVPSEATMLFAGFKVDDGDLTLLGITAAGVLGNVVGSWAGYAIGYYGREELLERHHVFHVSQKQMARVEGGSTATAGSPSSSPGCCRSSVPSSRPRPAPPTCPSGASPPTRRRAAFLGADARASSASRSAPTGRMEGQAALLRLRRRPRPDWPRRLGADPLAPRIGAGRRRKQRCQNRRARRGRARHRA